MPEKGASRHIEGQMDLNTSSEQDLAKVSDIGPARARKIVEYRNQHGGFNSVEDLMQVEGFDRTLMEDLRVALTVGEPAGR